MGNAKTRQVRLVHFSDIHCGSQYFVANLLDRTLVEVNDLAPDAVVITGDLTNMGYRQEFREAREYLDRLDCPNVMISPGNHDSRNVGYLHFERLFGERDSALYLDGVTVVGVDSSEPDLDYGRIGRHRYPWIKACLEEGGDGDTLRVFALHHHLLPVPGTGRERNVVHDAGDVLEVLLENRVKLVLSGHKHVPYVWRLEDMFVVNTGTISTLRLRGDTKPCYNVIDVAGDRVTITRHYPFRGGAVIVEFNAAAATYTRHEDHVDRVVTDV